jgi:hypothetical protein
MCDWHGGTYAGNLCVDLANGKWCSVDACIQPLVQAINDAGILTLNCCCVHGQRPGWIALADGRHILIAKDHAEKRRIDAGFPALSRPVTPPPLPRMTATTTNHLISPPYRSTS